MWSTYMYKQSSTNATESVYSRSFHNGLVLIKNQKVITNIVANMSPVEIIKEVITDKHWVRFYP